MADNNERERKSPPPVPVRPVRRTTCFLCGIPILGHHGLCHQLECTRSFLNRPTLAEDTDKSEERTDSGSVQQPDQGKDTPGPNRGGSQLGGRGRRESLLSKQIREYDLQQAALRSGPAQDSGPSQEPLAVAADLPPAPLAQGARPSPAAPVLAADLSPAPLAQGCGPSQAAPALAADLPPAPLAQGAPPSLPPAVAASPAPSTLAQDLGPSQAAPAEDPSATGSDEDLRIPRSEPIPIPIPIIGFYRDDFISAPVTPEPLSNVNVSDPEHVIFFPDSPLVVPSAPEHTK